jgi:hypothetical protein
MEIFVEKINVEKNWSRNKQRVVVQSSVAPMMDWTDNHYRTLARLISKHAWLYTEMVVADTLTHQQDNLVSSFLGPDRCWKHMILRCKGATKVPYQWHDDLLGFWLVLKENALNCIFLFLRSMLGLRTFVIWMRSSHRSSLYICDYVRINFSSFLKLSIL